MYIPESILHEKMPLCIGGQLLRHAKITSLIFVFCHLQGTVTAASPYNADQAAGVLRKAMKGLGTVEQYKSSCLRLSVLVHC